MVLRVLLAAVGAILLCWAYFILDNIWHYNDSGTFTYIAYASVPAVAGAACLYLAYRSARAARAGAPPRGE